MNAKKELKKGLECNGNFTYDHYTSMVYQEMK